MLKSSRCRDNPEITSMAADSYELHIVLNNVLYLIVSSHQRLIGSIFPLYYLSLGFVNHKVVFNSKIHYQSFVSGFRCTYRV